jgi:hypothetical protein
MPNYDDQIGKAVQEERGLKVDSRSYMDSRSSDAPSDMPEIARELTMLRGALVTISKVVSALREQIEPVLIPQDANKAAGEDVPEQPRSALGRDIRTAYEEAAMIANWLAEMLYRIQL